jgi:hypothetical protein
MHRAFPSYATQFRRTVIVENIGSKDRFDQQPELIVKKGAHGEDKSRIDVVNLLSLDS